MPSDACLDALVQGLGPQMSIFLRVHQTKKGTPTQFIERHLAGPTYIREELHIAGRVYTFQISPSSFFQPNTYQAQRLYAEVLSHVAPGERVLDLYAGTGTIGMVVSSRAKEVVAVELNPDAVRDGERNASLNQVYPEGLKNWETGKEASSGSRSGASDCALEHTASEDEKSEEKPALSETNFSITRGISNMRFLCGDVGAHLASLRAQGDFDTVIVDPPRAGLDPKALHHLASMRPKKIIYISCNPATQAPNVDELKKVGYQVTRVQPVDQFPHTYHIENIVVLQNH
jgi:23S rRNA (uracil1939-C5)-methyltransferase